jgi:hypothetical protein
VRARGTAGGLGDVVPEEGSSRRRLKDLLNILV